MNVTLDLTFLRDWQKDVFKKLKRFNILVIHRRAGKTVVGVCILVYKALLEPGDYGYIAPTYKQAKRIVWRMLLKVIKTLPGVKTNSSELMVTIFNGSTITLFGADTPDSLRGLDLKGVVFDEYAQQPSGIYGEIIFPMINANGGWALWIGTPKGKNNFYKLYQKGLIDDKYFVKMLKASQSGLLSQEALQDARDEMTEEEYNQEYECSWTASIKGAVYGKELAKAYEEQRIRKGLYDPMLPVYTWWDLGMRDAMTIGFFQIVGNEPRMIDSYKNTGYGLDHYAKVLKEKPYTYEHHYFPHDAAVKELGTGMTRLDTAKNLLGNHCSIVPKLSLEEGISAARIIFKNVWFDEDKCGDFLNDVGLYQYEWDDRIGDFKKEPTHDFSSHYADMFRYFAVSFKNVTTTKNTEVVESDYSGFL